MLLVSLSVVLLMLGSRLVTLRFGQVFPAQTAAERERFASLEERVKGLDEIKSKLAFLESENERLTEVKFKVAMLEAENERLTSEVQTLKNVEPVVIYQKSPSPVVKSPIRKTAEPTPVTVSNESLSDSKGNVAHRGDSMKTARRIFGKPESSLVFGNTEFWYYSDNQKSLTFDDGKISAWNDMPVEP